MVSLMSFEDQPPVAYSEGLSTGKIHESPAVVARLQDIYALALSDALPRRESLAMVRAAAKDYGHEDRTRDPGRVRAARMAQVGAQRSGIRQLRGGPGRPPLRVPVRDSESPHDPALLIPAAGWSSFVAAVKAGRLAA